MLLCGFLSKNPAENSEASAQICSPGLAVTKSQLGAGIRDGNTEHESGPRCLQGLKELSSSPRHSHQPRMESGLWDTQTPQSSAALRAQEVTEGKVTFLELFEKKG